MMFDYYVNIIKDDAIIEIIKELGLFLHKKHAMEPLSEVTHIDKSLCIDDSYVEDYVRKVQNAHNKEPKFQDIKSPWRTRGNRRPHAGCIRRIRKKLRTSTDSFHSISYICTHSVSITHCGIYV